MNDAHLHMVVNHFPIIGTILGLGVLVAGLILKNNSVKNTAYILFVVSAIFAAFSMATGEGAEEMVEDMPNIGKQIIHEHEEMAEKLALVLYVLGVISLTGLYLNFRKLAKASWAAYAAVIVALISLFFVKETGTTGGEIRHTEIRENAAQTNDTNQKAVDGEQEKNEDKD